jgi:hypothetical protein
MNLRKWVVSTALFVGSYAGAEGWNYDFENYLAASPGGYASVVRGGIIEGALQCGFEIVDGRDQRLPSSVLSRNVQEVLVKVKPNDKLEVHVLFDVVDTFNQNQFATQLLKRNGGRIMELEVDTEFEDIAIKTDVGGQLAYTTSSRKNHVVETVWRVRGPQGGMKRVTEGEFSQYLKTKIIAVWSDRICKGKYKL